MKIFKYEENGHTLELVCSHRNTRGGFAHDCTLLVDDRDECSRSRHYTNRTWERYAYQSVILDTLGTHADGLESMMRERFKDAHGYKRMNPARETEFEAFAEEQGGRLAENLRTVRHAREYYDTEFLAHKTA